MPSNARPARSWAITSGFRSTPGGRPYGVNQTYDYVPIRWDLHAGQTWHFQFPTGNVVFFDPNLTPVPANPQGGFVEIRSPMKLDLTKPAGYGDWDAAKLTWDVLGPASPGGPVGSPGADGLPGTADDEYAWESKPAIALVDPPVGQNLLRELSGPGSDTTLSLDVSSTGALAFADRIGVTATRESRGGTAPRRLRQ